MPQKEHVYLTAFHGKTVLRVNGLSGEIEIWDRNMGVWRRDTAESTVDSLKSRIAKMSNEDCLNLADFINKQLTQRAEAAVDKK